MTSEAGLMVGRMDDMAGEADSELGPGTTPARSMDRSSLRGLSSKKQKKVKRSLKDLPQDEGVLSQLREKILLQRLIAASSTETSQNESWNSSLPQSDISRDVTPLQTVREVEPEKAVNIEGVSFNAMPSASKIAITLPDASQQYVTEEISPTTLSNITNTTAASAPRITLDPHLQTTVKQVNRLTAPKQRSRGAHNAPDRTQLDVQDGETESKLSSLSSVCVSDSVTSRKSRGKPRKFSAPALISGGRKPSKPRLKNTITTSSWRAGQELVARELGLGKFRTRDNAKKGNTTTTANTTTTTSTSFVDHGLADRGESGKLFRTSNSQLSALAVSKEASASTGRSSSVPPSQPRSVKDSASKNVPDAPMDNSDKGSLRTASKRKATKVEPETEKPEPAEKQRHYNSDSVRQFMAKQKADRHKQREESRIAQELGRQKRHSVMQDLINKQRSAATSASNPKTKKGKETERNKELSSFLSDTHDSYESHSLTMIPMDTKRENLSEGRAMNMEEDENSDGDTLTGGSGEGSTPRASTVARHGEGQPVHHNDSKTHLNNISLSGLEPSTASTPLQPPSPLSPSKSKPIQFQGKTLNLDVNSALSRFSHVVNQRQSQGSSSLSNEMGRKREVGFLDGVEIRENSVGFLDGGGGRERVEGLDNGGGRERGMGVMDMDKRRQERLQTLRVTSLDLQSKIASATAEMSSSSGKQATVSKSGSPETTASTLGENNLHSSRRDKQPSKFAASQQRKKMPNSSTDKGGFVMAVQCRAPSTGGNLRRGNVRSEVKGQSSASSRPSRQPEKVSSISEKPGNRLNHTLPQRSNAHVKATPTSTASQPSLAHTFDGHTSVTREGQSKVTPKDKVQGSQRVDDGGGGGGVSSVEEKKTKAAISGHISQQPTATLTRQTSDTGQDTDVSLTSEEDLALSPKTSHAEIADRSWSPAAFERQMATELRRLENLEESIRRLSRAERSRAIALAHQETVSVAQVLKAGQEAHSAELRSLQHQVQEERLASAQQLQQFNSNQESSQMLEVSDNGQSELEAGDKTPHRSETTSEGLQPFTTPHSRNMAVVNSSLQDDTVTMLTSPSTAAALASPHLPSLLSSGDDSLNRFTIDTVRNIMREEEMRAQHQEALLRIRIKAVKEKMQAQLSLLHQERQQLMGKGKGHAGLTEGVKQKLQFLAERERVILQEQEEHEREIERMFRSEELAREHRQSLLKQHEQIAQMQEETAAKMKHLQGRLVLQEQEQTENETSLVEDLSDASEVSLSQDSTSQMKKQKVEKQQRLRLDHKYLTSREQKLMARRKQASELLRWKRDLDAEEEKVLQLERTALEAWEGKGAEKSLSITCTGGVGGGGETSERDETENKVKAPGNLRPEPGTPRTQRHSFNQSDPSNTRPRSASTNQDAPGNTEKRGRETSVCEGEEEGEGSQKGKRSTTVGRLLPPGNSALPLPWSHKTGSESESEESVSHTETQSDVSDYEVRIRQLSDMLRRRRKEADMLKKECSKRMKDKLKKQEESLKKQLEAYEIYISQVKSDQSDLEQESSRPTVTPKIKQPGPNTGRSSPGPLTPPPTGQGHQFDEVTSSNEEEKNLSSSSVSEAMPESKIPSLASKNKETPSSSFTFPSDSKQLNHDRSRSDSRKPRSERSAIPRSTSREKEKASTPRSASKETDKVSTPRSASKDIDKVSTPRSASKEMDKVYTPRSASQEANTTSFSPSKETNKATLPESIASQESDKTTPRSASQDGHKSGIPRSISTDRDNASLENKSGIPRRVGDKSATSNKPAADCSQTKENVSSRSTLNTSPRVSVDLNTNSGEEFLLEKHSQSEKHQTHTDKMLTQTEKTSTHTSKQTDVIEVKPSELASQGMKHSRIPISVKVDISPSTTTTTKSEVSPLSPPSPLYSFSSHKVEPRSESGSVTVATSSHPITGIQESDSETSHPTHSRPSSERSTGSTTFSDLHDFEEVEEDILNVEWDRGPVREYQAALTSQLEQEEKEGVSASESSASQTRGTTGPAGGGNRDDDSTSTLTPRSNQQAQQDNAPDPLLMTDPLADFHTGDRVQVWSHLTGALRFKGPVHFAPGFWAGVELDQSDGDTDGQRDGQRYFTCPASHGLLVPGSDISAVEDDDGDEEGVVGGERMVKSPDDSLTDHDEATSTSDTETFKQNLGDVVKVVSDSKILPWKSPDLDILNDSSESLSRTYTKDDVVALKSTNIETLNYPKEASTSDKHISSDNSQVTDSVNKILSAPLKKAKPFEEDDTSEKESESKTQKSENKSTTKNITADKTSSEQNNLIDSAVTKITQVRRYDSVENNDSAMVSGSSDYDSGVDRSYDAGSDHMTPLAPEPGSSGEQMVDGKSQVTSKSAKTMESLTVFGSQTKEESEEYIFSGTLGTEDDFFMDDEFGRLTKPSLSAADSADNSTQSHGGGSPVPASHASSRSGLFIIPHDRTQVDPIVANALSVYWDLRRCEEPWDTVSPPTEYLNERSTPGGDTNSKDTLVTGSRRTFRHLVFDLTGDIIREIYQHENVTEPPPWQKPAARKWRYFKGSQPPTTLDTLLPVVQTTVGDILGLNGCSGRHRGVRSKRWNVRKKKDHVDSVLVGELHEEEGEWINYTNDEFSVKMQVSDTLLESLLADTVVTLNKVYARRQLHWKTA